MAGINRILVRSGKSPLDVLSNESAAARKTFGVFASNTGNFLFTHAVHRALNVPGAEVLTDSLTSERVGMTDKHTQRINDEFDAFVIPLANAFRESFRPPLRRLTNVIESLDIPVVVTGVGSQVGLDGNTKNTSDDLDEDCRRFVSAVLDRSATIGVRGEITKDYLLKLGFSDSSIDIVGCPSLHDFDGRAPIISPKVSELTSTSKLAINITPRVKGMSEVLRRHHAEYDDLIYVPQNHEELLLLLWGQEFSGFPEGLPASEKHFMYREGKIRFFTDAKPWKDFLFQRDFVFGNRIHGNIAALAAGTPAVLLAHDSRTLELAEFHGIPFVPMPSRSQEVDARRLFDEMDLTALNERRQSNRACWERFLEKNNLSHIHQEDKANEDYSLRLAKAEHPNGVKPLAVASQMEMGARVKWLWQGIKVDQYRPHGAYVPEFEPSTQSRRSTLDVARSAEKKAKTLENELMEVKSQLEVLLDGEQKYGERLDDHLASSSVPFERRVYRAIRARLGALRRRLQR